MEEKRIYAQRLRVGLFAVEPIRREGLRSILEEIRGIELIDAGLDGLLVAESLDLAVISLMVRSEILTTIERLRAATPSIRIIVMSEDGDDESVIAAIMAGAKGYLLDTATPDEVSRAVELVASGSIWAPRRTLSLLVDRMIDGGTISPRSAPQFTHRELEVLQLLVSARSNREIAEALGIEVRTVKSYVGRMMRKVGVGNRIALSIHAAKHALGGGPGQNS
ncbi:response regulator transcription factor [Alloacidobacterium dinghuense]|uniref:Response regulator transcription factor n=1 Tax=Alloacidobacterium dinghuense TaxID=2763107 RepID=A0A7G8BN81_9BACT|nr:response regulator transcription factor [Alloacidobacterium dinghuense]QNI34001.1 response regulator transcription factor [Alloacidobacterium dinghuense]